MFSFLGILLLTQFSFAAVHPLADLSAEEIEATVKIIKESKKFTEHARFPILSAKEPLKKDYLKFQKTKTGLSRESFVLVFEVKKNEVYEVTVDLDSKKIKESKRIKGVQPPVLLEEYDRLNKIVRDDKRWQKAIKKRGLDINEAYVDSWAGGLLSPQERKSGARLMRGVSYLKGKRKNYYARPIEGLIVTVDMNKNAVVDVWDTEKIRPAEGEQELDPSVTIDTSKNLKPLEVKQSQGVSFRISGQEVQWDRWSFRYSLHPMKGLILHDVKFKDKFKDRSVLYKGSISEMVVPYGDSSKAWSFRSAFDVGEYGLGRTSHSLEPGLDVPSNATLIDAVFADDVGGLIQIPKAVAIYERDGGLLWKHMDQNSREAFGRRARELVITFTTTIGNYDYGLSWIFHQDGVIEPQLHLTGIMLAKGTPFEKNPCDKECKHLVEPKVAAPNHQHFFTFRLDFDVDGPANTPMELNTQSLPKSQNPYANAFETVPTYLAKEEGRDLNLSTARKWKIINKEVSNSIGHPVGYALVPGENSIPYLLPSSPIRQRARFLNHHVWFTKYNDAEQSAAGDYPNQNFSGDGVEKWISGKESLAQQDVVMWYVFGVTHIARPEEWPVMSVHKTGFKILPINFFSANPTILE